MLRMKDARLAELEFLGRLESDALDLRCRPDMGDDETYGLGAQRFRDMVLGLLLEGCLNGTPRIAWNASHPWADREASVMQAFNEIVQGQTTRLVINHRGLLRLARLRQELKAGRTKERFEILLDQRHWKRDMTIAMLDVTKDRPITIVLSDLDHFKAVNDRIGYERGDQCLRRYFRVAHDVLGEDGDVYCRGGDEVLAILPSTAADKGDRLAEALRRAVEEEFRAPEQEGLKPITLSAGMATFEARIDADEASSVVTRRLHRAKDAGRNRAVSEG